MKFNEALEIATQASDVEGIKKRVSPIVRRKVPAGYTAIKSKKKKKRKKESDETK